MEESRKSRRGVSCLVTGAVIAGILLIALLVPSPELGYSGMRQRQCEVNLKQLNDLVSVYSQQFGGSEKRFPSETGRAFWLRLTETKPPLVSGDMLDIFVCPGGDDLRGTGLISYWGPGKDVNSLRDEDVIACCDSPGHPDGVMFLRKNGSIVHLKPDSPEALRLKAQLKK